jgi:hypothetical protein
MVHPMFKLGKSPIILRVPCPKNNEYVHDRIKKHFLNVVKTAAIKLNIHSLKLQRAKCIIHIYS